MTLSRHMIDVESIYGPCPYYKKYAFLLSCGTSGQINIAFLSESIKQMYVPLIYTSGKSLFASWWRQRAKNQHFLYFFGSGAS